MMFNFYAYSYIHLQSVFKGHYKNLDEKASGFSRGDELPNTFGFAKKEIRLV